MYRQASSIGEQVLRPEDSQVASSLDGLGILFVDQGRYAQAAHAPKSMKSQAFVESTCSSSG